MKDGRILICMREHSGRNGFRLIVDHFENGGITLANPGSSMVSLIDALGEQVPSSQVELASIFDRAVGNDYVFQWWLDEGTDLLAKVEWSFLCEYQSFYLDGLLVEEVAMIEHVIAGLVGILPALIAVVVDLQGRCWDVDFGDVFSRPDRLPDARPDRIYVPEGVAADLYTFRNLEPADRQPGVRIYSAESSYGI